MNPSFTLLFAAAGLLSAAAQEAPVSPFSALPQEPPAADAGKTIVRPTEETMLGRSELLSDGTHWTLVPKGAVVHIPANLSAKVAAKPVGKLLSWSDFFMVNRAWLLTEEISIDQAAGRLPLGDDRREAWAKLGKVVVAVHQTGPISVKATSPATTPTTASTR